MKKKKILALVMTTIVASTMFISCGSADTADKDNKPKNQGDNDPMGKYEEPVKITGILNYSAAGDEVPSDVSPENFSYITQAKEQLNIDFEWLWTSPTAQFDQKFGVAMASNSLPDFMTLSAVDYEVLKDNEQLLELSDLIDNYAGEDFKNFLYKDQSVLDAITDEDGSIYAIPQYWDNRRTLNMLLIRKDWLDKLGLEVPKTTDDLEKVAKAFIDNGLAATGIAMGRDFEGNYSMANYLMSFGVYPYKWVDDGEGNLEPGEIQPEAKEALEYMSKLYKDGILAKDFATLESKQVSESIVSGNCGILYGPWWYFDATLRDNKLKDPNAEWISAPIATSVSGESANKGKALIPRVSISDYHVINKDCENPEAVIKLFNLDLSGEMYGKEWALPENRYVWNWVPTKYYDPFDINTFYDKMTTQGEKDITVAEPEGFTPDDQKFWSIYQEYDKYLKGETTEFKKEYGRMMSRAGMGWESTVEIKDSGAVAYDEFYGTATKTMKQKQATLKKLTEETFTKIVMGEQSIDTFDKFVEDWKKLGGDSITEEVNQWYKDTKK